MLKKFMSELLGIPTARIHLDLAVFKSFESCLFRFLLGPALWCAFLDFSLIIFDQSKKSCLLSYVKCAVEGACRLRLVHLTTGETD